MSNNYKQPVQTSAPSQSIWRDVDQGKFRKKVVELEIASKEVPRDPKVNRETDWPHPGVRPGENAHVLPFGVEQQLADDLAFISAAEEGVNAVSAVGLEEATERSGIVVRLAANEGIMENVQETLKMIFGLLEQCASRSTVKPSAPFSKKKKILTFLLELTRETCAQQIFEKVMILSRTRIHSRLQSAQWKKPTYFRSDPEPLHQGLKKFSHWLGQQNSESRSESAILVQQLDSICSVCRRIDGIQGDTEEELQHLKDIVRKSYNVCTSNGNCTLENTISAHGFDSKHVCHNKYIRQVDKIGRYWGSCRLMAEASRKYKEMFMNVELQVIPPYRELKSPISFKGRIVSCHVHAEIQLLVFYGLNPDLSTSIPRILGVSKSACYLCDLFIQKHNQFFITKTHGRLHDQWTVPDLAEFSPNQRSEYQRILSEMYKEFELEITKARYYQPRKYPQGSWLSLPTVLPMSLATSNAGTTVSESSGHRTVTPRIPSVAHTPRQNSPLLRNIITRNEQLTEITVSNVSNNNNSPSSEVSTRPKFPIHKRIAEDAPFYVTSGKLFLEVGLEGSGQHEITIDTTKYDQRIGDNIDVGEMIPGKELEIERNNPENRILLTLRYGTDTSLQLTL